MIHKIYKLGDDFVEADLAGGIGLHVQHISEETREESEEIEITLEDEKKLNRLKTRKSRNKVLNDIIKDIEKEKQ